MSRARRSGRWAYRGDDPLVELVTRLANETGQSPERVAKHLDEAVDAGLIEFGPCGLRAVLPGEVSR